MLDCIQRELRTLHGAGSVSVSEFIRPTAERHTPLSYRDPSPTCSESYPEQGITHEEKWKIYVNGLNFKEGLHGDLNLVASPKTPREEILQEPPGTLAGPEPIIDPSGALMVTWWDSLLAVPRICLWVRGE